MLFFFARRFRPSCLAGVIALTAGLVLAGPATQAQGTTHRHLIEFRDKTGTPYTVGQPLQYLSPRAVSRRQRQQIAVLPRDLPPTPAYVQQVRAVAGVTVIYRTRWLNGLVIECDTNRLTQVLALPFVRSGRTLNRAVAGGRTHPVRRVDEQRPSSPNPYGIAFAQAEQIGATTMHAAGFRGEGMHIAVLDAGFPGVNVIPAFQPLFQQNRLLSTFDVVRGGTNVYDIDSHGTWVLSTMAAYQPNAFIGTAPNASYHLIRTEDNRGTESPVEEAYWLIGAEYADSVGVDIINSSLGYRDFDNPDFSYSYSQMDGNTALSTRAADLASAVGILVVNSAGNSGNNASWPYVSAPADGDSVLSVGAVDSLGVRIGFSSIGPTADGQIKPNLATQGSQTAIIDPSGFIGRGSGTSFASPVLAGMAAGFWQANPTLNAMEVIATGLGLTIFQLFDRVRLSLEPEVARPEAVSVEMPSPREAP